MAKKPTGEVVGEKKTVSSSHMQGALNLLQQELLTGWSSMKGGGERGEQNKGEERRERRREKEREADRFTPPPLRPHRPQQSRR